MLLRRPRDVRGRGALGACTLVALLAAVLVAVRPAPALAQSSPDRGYVGVNGLFQASTREFGDAFTFERELETGSTDVDYRVGSGPAMDAGGGIRLWKRLGVGVSVSSFTRKEAASTTSRFPHPFFFDRFRDVEGDATNVARTETAVHVQVLYVLDPPGPLRIVLSGGPSFVQVEQDIVTEVLITQSFPFDTASFASARTEKAKESATTYNVGADVTWVLHRHIGVGGLVRFSPTSIDLTAPGGRTIAVDAGGLQAGGGLRVIF
jgi:hypothetical protein